MSDNTSTQKYSLQNSSTPQEVETSITGISSGEPDVSKRYSEYPINGEEHQQQSLQDASQMQKQFSAPEIDDRKTRRLIKLNFQWDREPSKDQCMYCQSAFLEQQHDGIVCKNCLFFQEKPILGYDPKVVTSNRKTVMEEHNDHIDDSSRILSHAKEVEQATAFQNQKLGFKFNDKA